MKQYIWILSADMVLHLKEAGGVSSTYILPKSHAQIDPAGLIGGHVWMLLRGVRGDVFFACIHVDMVEQFEDGLNIGDFLLTIDLAKSYRCSSTYDSGIMNFFTDKTPSLPFGVKAIDGADFIALSAQAARAIAIKLKKPSQMVWDKANVQFSQEATFITAEMALAAITGKFALEDIWAGSKPKLPPFANFTYHALLSTYGESVGEKLIGDLSRLDPTLIRAETPKSADSGDGLYRKPIVNINMSPIDPAHIYARKFITSSNNPIEFADIIEKVERAEKRHQDMLRDIVTRLKAMGFLALQSASLDLFVSTQHGVSIFEIKTATPQNILPQAAKGAFQLGCYKTALQEAGYGNCHLILVMETTGTFELESYVVEILRSFGISVLFYDIAKSWPDKLKGLENLVDSGDGY